MGFEVVTGVFPALNSAVNDSNMALSQVTVGVEGVTADVEAC